MILQNISRRVVGNDLITISPSNILPIMLWLGRFQQNCRLVLAAVSINGLKNPVNSLLFQAPFVNKENLLPADISAKYQPEYSWLK